jgi:hypothetical protein
MHRLRTLLEGARLRIGLDPSNQPTQNRLFAIHRRAASFSPGLRFHLRCDRGHCATPPGHEKLTPYRLSDMSRVGASLPGCKEL